MNNYERLKALDSDSFVDKIQKLFDTPFKADIDWKAYMKGESENIHDYFFSKKQCDVLPSEAELITVFGTKTKPAEGEREKYIKEHTERMILLHETTVYGSTMYTVADIKNNRILKVPARFVRVDGEGV